MNSYHLAQINIATMRFPSTQAPEMAGFMNNLDRINALAEQSKGFVWRLQSEEGNATEIKFFGDQVIVNMSVWEDMGSLFDYTYRSDHLEVMGRRRAWFHKHEKPHSVMWWVESGHQPSLKEAKERLEHLQLHGPSAFAFTFKKPFPSPSESKIQPSTSFEDLCPAT